MRAGLALFVSLSAAPACAAAPEALRAGADLGLLRLSAQRPTPVMPTPLRTIPLAEIRSADECTFVAVETRAGAVSAGIAFGYDYEQFLHLRGPGPAAAFSWKGLASGADWGGLRVATDDSAARLCPATGHCATVAVGDLLDRAYKEGL